MAYITQAEKKVIAAKMKEFMPKDWKYSLSIDNHSSITCRVKSAPVDLYKEMNEDYHKAIRDGHYSANTHVSWLVQIFKEGEVLNTIIKIIDALNTDNHDNSDIMTDYFDVGHYIHLEFGRWDKPFINTSK